MPHLVLEHSGNVREHIDPAVLFGALHRQLAAVGGFRIQDFKSRLVRMDQYFIGDGTREQSFVNLDVRTFGGKSAETRAAISAAALAVLASAFEHTLRERAATSPSRSPNLTGTPSPVPGPPTPIHRSRHPHEHLRRPARTRRRRHLRRRPGHRP
ncbi:5-carboxymethyl-2-hydroxymuconate Delta-isomerase [Streptomyces sp. DI166]|uniref:5-carboxymethyl-2-hydroxymuconate Delta-isomerase n=1 Tax=Streptomyces TaxID=1883 RepID=UPI00159EE845